MNGEAAHKHQMTNTHILVQGFAYYEPASVQETVSLLNAYGYRAKVLAGGTYLLVQMKMERDNPECVINIGAIPDLEGLSHESGGLKIGARTSIWVLRHTGEIQERYSALAEACGSFGSTQIQKMGTIGGNLCNGSPASDAVPALMALNARLVVVGPEGERTLSGEEFLLGPGETDLRRGELLTSVCVPNPLPGTGSAFIKVSRVTADLAKVSAAAVILREDDRVVECRLAYGSVAPKVLRVKRAEEMLVGCAFSPELALEAGRVASEAVSPIDDVRSTAWYRREVVKVATHDVLCKAWERAGKADQDREAKDKGEASGGATEVNANHVALAGAIRLEAGEEREIELTVNGKKYRKRVAPNELLVNVLRERLELIGTKYGCGIGECGACTVHLNGEPALSCLVLAVAADGSEVTTVEGLQRPDGELDPLQDAFIENQAFQCGYCTPGMLMISKSLLKDFPTPSEDDVRDYLRGNRCRCTGFASIVRAVLSCVQDNGG
jgi:carbon-monoxide dehydrogenase medium subunit